LPIDGAALQAIQTPKKEPRMMRDELTDNEWAAIRPMLPNKARGDSVFVRCAAAIWWGIHENRYRRSSA
jgi:hypothetical protein